MASKMGNTKMPEERAEPNPNRVKNQIGLSFRCSEYEAVRIREAAARERRTVSSFVLNAVMNRVTAQQGVFMPSAKSSDLSRRRPNSHSSGRNGRPAKQW